MALARALGHEPRPDAQPAPDLPRPGAVPRQVGRPRAPAHGRAGRRRRHRRRQAVAARARQGHRLRRHRLDPVPPDRAVPQRGGDLRDQRAGQRAAHRRHPGRPRACSSRGDTAYVRGELGAEREYRIFREPRPLVDPTTKEILGYEATYVGTAEYTVEGGTRTGAGRQGRDHSGHLHGDQHPHGGRRRRPAGAGAGARVHQLRAAPAARRRSAARSSRSTATPSPPARTRSSRSTAALATASSAATCWRCGATARSWSTGPRPGARTDQAAGRAPRRAVRVPRVRAHVVRADPVGEASRSRPATSSRSPDRGGPAATRAPPPGLSDRGSPRR